MKKIVVFFCDNDHEALIFWNIDNLISSLNKTDCDFIFKKISNPDNLIKYINSNIVEFVIFYRCIHFYNNIFNMLRKFGIKNGYYIDDYLWGDSPYKDDIVNNYISRSNFFIGWNSLLLSKLPNKPKILTPHGLSSDFFNKQLSKSDKLEILINKAHPERKFKNQITDIINKVDYKLQKKASLNIIGNFEKNDWNFNVKNIDIKFHNYENINSYFNKIYKFNPHIVLCPLEVSEFTNCKCPIKLMEASNTNSVLIASPIYPYIQYGTDNENCMFANSDVEFVEKILWCSNNIKKVKNIGLNANKLLSKELSLDLNCVIFINQLKKLSINKDEAVIQTSI